MLYNQSVLAKPSWLASRLMYKDSGITMNESSLFITATTVSSSLLDWSRVCIVLYVIESSIASNLRTLCQVHKLYEAWKGFTFEIEPQESESLKSTLTPFA
jgi:RNA polymerase subunit RPABC4/transcription elongation factor Spt4